MIVEEIKNIKSGKSDLRKFGITMGIVLMLLGGLFFWREKGYYFYFFIFASGFIVTGLAVPGVLKPAHKVWMTISIILGWIMTRVILSILFYLVVTPTRWLARLFGKQFLDLKINKNVKSYWIPKKELKLNKADYEKQF
ncbi:MAG: SxtJ family membrane protein [Desulfobacterales bacterium]|nr:SxtJ family membrane protein [Desulfobacterales bacterium]